jgi:hypothetical protein
MCSPRQTTTGILALLLLTGLASFGQAATRPMFGPTGRDNRVRLYKVFALPLQIKIERGFIVTKKEDTLRGYIAINGFIVNDNIKQVAILPFGKQDHSDIQQIKMDAIDYVVIQPARSAYPKKEYRYAPVGSAMWTLVGQNPRVRICMKDRIIIDDYGFCEKDFAMIMFSDSARVDIPFPSGYTLRPERYYLGKFILQRYGEEYSRLQLRQQDPIKVILDKENQRISTHLTKTS